MPKPISENIESKPKNKGKYEKIEPGLYRYRKSGEFCSILKVDGKVKYKMLGVSDKSTARRILAQTRNESDALDPNLSGLGLGKLSELYLSTIQGLAVKTNKTRKGIVKSLLATIPPEKKVRDLKPSDISTWEAGLKMKKSSRNEYVRVVKDIFDLAVKDKVIMNSPAKDLHRVKEEKPPRLTPTEDQFRQIVTEIRTQRLNPHAEGSADFIEFMGLAGLGQAELRNLRLCDIREREVKLEDTKSGETVRTVRTMDIRRQKTKEAFTIPVYPQLEELLTKLVAKASLPVPQTNQERSTFGLRPLFTIKDPKKAFSSACERLGFPKFEPRGNRRLLITKAVEKGIDFKTIAAMQGHRDGGVLIAKTYSHLRQEHLDSMAARLV